MSGWKLFSCYDVPESSDTEKKWIDEVISSMQGHLNFADGTEFAEIKPLGTILLSNKKQIQNLPTMSGKIFSKDEDLRFNIPSNIDLTLGTTLIPGYHDDTIQKLSGYYSIDTSLPLIMIAHDEMDYFIRMLRESPEIKRFPNIEEYLFKHVLRHELGHLILGTKINIGKKLIHESYANYFAHNAAPPIEKRFMEYISYFHKHPWYNYYLILNHWDQNRIILKAIFSENEEYINNIIQQYFPNDLAQLPKENKGIILKKPHRGFLGYASNQWKIASADTVDAVGFIRNGLFIINKIRILSGYIDESNLIIANSIENADYYKTENGFLFPSHIYRLDEERFDLKKLVRECISPFDLLQKLISLKAIDIKMEERLCTTQ